MPRTCLLTLFVAVLASAAVAQPTPAQSVRPADPAPAFHPGMPVVDRTGATIGAFEAFATGPVGPLAVLRIDGKPVAVPQATLALDGQRILSRQSKAEMLSAAEVPR